MCSSDLRFIEAEDLSFLDIDKTDSEQLFLTDELRSILDSLEKAYRSISYLSRPIKSSSVLYKNNRGRYEARDGSREYTSGSGIEALVYDDYNECNKWVSTRVEHDGQDYYLVGYKNVGMDGLKTRVRASGFYV